MVLQCTHFNTVRENAVSTTMTIRLEDELKERLEHLCKYDGLMSTFEKYFQSNENSNQPQPTEGGSIPNKVINDES